MSLKDHLNVFGKTMKYSFSIPIKKKITKINKEGNETDKSISYKIKFIDSIRFMAT